MLNHALNIHDAAEKPKDREWIHILLHFLRAYVEDGGRDLLSEEDNKAYMERLIAALREAAQNLDNGECYNAAPAVTGQLKVYCDRCTLPRPPDLVIVTRRPSREVGRES